MPLYEYECEACGHKFELIRKFSDAPLTACPKCGGAVRKLISSPAFQFKGSGWYATDYAKKTDTGKSEKNEKSEKKSEAATDTSSKATDTPATPAAPTTKTS